MRTEALIEYENRTICEAWYNACLACMVNGHNYLVVAGSYVGQRRRQVPYLSLYIKHPEERPFGFKFGNVPISGDAAIEKYFYDYIVGTEIKAGEQYTYGSRIMPQFEATAEKLIESNCFTNQAVITIGLPSDIELSHPPCLREIAWKWHPDGLQMAVYFRSWDLCCALALNLGALQMLNEQMAELVGVNTGPMVAFSDGGHVYEQSWKMFDNLLSTRKK